MGSEGLTFCTGESNYHQYLSRLGLTPMNTQEELDLLGHHRMPIHNFTSAKGHDKKGKLFLIEIGQFDNRKNQTMADDIVTDLELFLELDTGYLPRSVQTSPRNTDGNITEGIQMDRGIPVGIN